MNYCLYIQIERAILVTSSAANSKTQELATQAEITVLLKNLCQYFQLFAMEIKYSLVNW